MQKSKIGPNRGLAEVELELFEMEVFFKIRALDKLFHYHGRLILLKACSKKAYQIGVFTDSGKDRQLEQEAFVFHPLCDSIFEHFDRAWFPVESTLEDNPELHLSEFLIEMKIRG